MFLPSGLLALILLFQSSYASPAPAVATITTAWKTTITSCSCTSKSTSKGHTSTFTLTKSSSCTSKHIAPTCKTSTSTIKVTTTSSIKSTSTSKSTSRATSTSTSKPTSSSPTSTPKPSSTTPTTTTPKSSSSSSSYPSSSSTSAAKKRGLPYNTPTYTNPFTSPKVTWAYNWYSYPYTLSRSPQTGYNPSLAFIPMLWSTASDLASVWSTNVQSSIKNYGTDAVLGFNEPDGCGGGQSCMNVSAAVAGWQTWMDPLAKTAPGVKLGSPAVTNGVGSGIGLDWLRQFLAACEGCVVDFVAVHWYGDAGGIADFESFVGEALGVAGGRPVWVTEFGTTSGSAADTLTFLEDAVKWLDGQGGVERYAWFWDAEGYLISADGTGLSEQGDFYNS